MLWLLLLLVFSVRQRRLWGRVRLKCYGSVRGVCGCSWVKTPETFCVYDVVGGAPRRGWFCCFELAMMRMNTAGCLVVCELWCVWGWMRWDRHRIVRRLINFEWCEGCVCVCLMGWGFESRHIKITETACPEATKSVTPLDAGAQIEHTHTHTIPTKKGVQCTYE